MNRKIIDYVLIVKTDNVSLNTEVNHMLDEGFEPYYAPFSSGTRIFYICQAMVKYEDLSNLGCDMNGYGQ